MRKYRTLGIPECEGKALWEDVFPDGEVPIQSIIPRPATLEASARLSGCFSQQQEATIEKISKRCGASKDAILKEVLKVGLPLQSISLKNFTIPYRR